MAASAPNPLKEMLKADKVALGMNVRLARSGDIARIAKTTGHDFIFIDAQHSLYTVETIGHIAQTALGIGIAPLVRVRSCDDPDTQVLLDNGVTGIVFPDVNNADEAKRAVNRAKFPPIGKRSVGGGYPIFDYRAVNTAESVPALNDNTLVVCMIETREGLENVEEIAAVEGVDVIHVGSNDLLTGLGAPGTFGSAQHIAALDRVFAAAKKHGKIPGVGGDRNVSRQVDFIRKGARFITTNSEIAFILAEGSRVTGELRKALA
ncbi:MAG TPA: aldolase/citrate lyase family protein [Burkholderiales bacterium]|jgi:2-keto-3-deoxy-L-rhamnonate aldolase RhmA|nr:aldolase/citrate lyase family protein [Burkholderiales bacterium]